MRNLVIGIGVAIMLLSTWIFGGIIGLIMGFFIFITGAFMGNGDCNFKLIMGGSGIILLSTIFIGGAIGITFGLFFMVLGAYLPGMK